MMAHFLPLGTQTQPARTMGTGAQRWQGYKESIFILWLEYHLQDQLALDRGRKRILRRTYNLIVFSLFLNSAPAFPASQVNIGTARSLLTTDLGCPSGSSCWLKGCQPQLAQLFSNRASQQCYWEKESLFEGCQILPLDVKEKRRGEDGEESPFRDCNQDQVVLN